MSTLVADLQRHLLDHPADDPGDVLSRLAPLLSRAERSDVLRQVAARREGLGAIDSLRADPAVSEIMINGPGPVWIERHGALSVSDVVLGAEDVDHLVERLVVPIGRRVDQRTPCVDGRLADGSRVHIAVPPIALDGPYITIRRFVLTEVALAAFLSPDGIAVLESAIDARHSIVVCGGTGTGKTTLLNAIACRLDPGERLLTVEDAAELHLPHPHVVRLETRPASAEGGGAITMRELVRNALRMRPDRLVIGEVRGPEAHDLMQALNTGHGGCLSTVHANSPLDALRRLETLALQGSGAMPLDAIRTQMAAAIDLLVQVGREGPARRVVEIASVSADASVHTVWRAR
ncbi:MAG: ATPase, T2SS/T4P/T4SS family [Actinomycetota bacterium]